MSVHPQRLTQRHSPLLSCPLSPLLLLPGYWAFCDALMITDLLLALGSSENMDNSTASCSTYVCTSTPVPVYTLTAYCIYHLLPSPHHMVSPISSPVSTFPSPGVNPLPPLPLLPQTRSSPPPSLTWYWRLGQQNPIARCRHTPPKLQMSLAGL